MLRKISFSGKVRFWSRLVGITELHSIIRKWRKNMNTSIIFNIYYFSHFILTLNSAASQIAVSVSRSSSVFGEEFEIVVQCVSVDRIVSRLLPKVWIFAKSHLSRSMRNCVKHCRSTLSLQCRLSRRGIPRIAISRFVARKRRQHCGGALCVSTRTSRI